DGAATVDYVTGLGTINKGWSPNGALTLGANNGIGALGSSSFNGTIYNNNTGLGYGGNAGGNLAIVKNGVNAQSIAGTIGYLGGTTVNSGRLTFIDNKTGSSAFTVNAPGTLEFKVTGANQILNGG